MYKESESGDAVFMVQPEEMGCYKSLRRVVDRVFTASARFLTSSVVYAEMDSAEDGVNRQLRAMLFVPPKRRKRGMPRTDAICKESDGNTESLSSVKRTQRQSKQKDRCENRLLSLLFATIYDPATKRCRLVHDVPPLKLSKTDKNGQIRTVSNYTDVRVYLRNAMTSILSAHSEAVKTLNQLLPDLFGVLPSLLMIIARTFMVVLKVNGSDEQSNDPSDMRERANEALDYCMNSIQSFITTWERRNFSTDNPLLQCLEAGTNNEYYKSVRTLLHTMINILPPSGREPYDSHFRRHHVHTFGSSNGAICDNEQGRRCLLGGECKGEISTESTPFDIDDYFEYINALSNCVRLPPVMDFDLLDNLVKGQGFSNASWRCIQGLCALHRMEMFTNRVRNQRSHLRRTRESKDSMYLEGVHWDIAGFWSAIGRSNFQSWNILDQLNILDGAAMNETAVELIFGGAMASISLFERMEDILPICANLRSKKGPMVVRLDEDNSDGDGCAGPNMGGHSPKQNDRGKTSNETGLAPHTPSGNKPDPEDSSVPVSKITNSTSALSTNPSSSHMQDSNNVVKENAEQEQGRKDHVNTTRLLKQPIGQSSNPAARAERQSDRSGRQTARMTQLNRTKRKHKIDKVSVRTQTSRESLSKNKKRTGSAIQTSTTHKRRKCKNQTSR